MGRCARCRARGPSWSRRSVNRSSPSSHGSPLEVDLYVPLGGVDACSHGLAELAVKLARAQVAQLAASQLADARVTDAHAAPERQQAPGALAADEHRDAGLARGV